MALKIWVGKRESDILTYKYFDVSITFWGSNTNNNHSFCTTERLKDNYNNDFTQYVLNLLISYISQNKNKHIQIHFYNNSFAYKLISLEPFLKDYVVNINSSRIFDIIRHKTLSRVWLQNTVAVPPFTYLSRNECNYDKLTKKFPHHTKFILQKSISGGGNGTYLICEDNWKNIIHTLNRNEIFLVSPYYENNISLSCHILIDNKNVVIFPILEQLLRYENNKILYRGNKFLDNDTLSINTKKVALAVGQRLMDTNFRGICGLDIIFSNNKILLIELNPRYLGSSYLINAELKNMNLPSLFELNDLAFTGLIKKNISEKIYNMKISYESHVCVYQKKDHDKVITNYPQKTLLYLDGLPNAHKYEDGAYLYRYLKKCSKTSLS